MFQLLEQQGQQSGKQQVECAGVEHGPDKTVAFDKGLAHPHDLVNRNDPGQRGVFDQGNDLIAHGGDDPLDDLHQKNMEKDLAAVQAKSLPGFDLPFWDAFNAAPVDLAEIAGIIDGEGQNDGGKAPHGRESEQEPRAIEDDDQLQHQRCTTDHPDNALHQQPQGRKAAHGAKAHEKPQWDGKGQGQQEDIHGLAEALQQGQGDGGKLTHITSPGSGCIFLPVRPACRRP